MADVLTNIMSVLESSFGIAFGRFADSLPYIIAAAIIMFVGYMVSVFISHLVQSFFDRIRLENVFKKFKVEDALGGINITHVLVKLLRWTLILIVLLFALNVLQLDEVTWLVKAMLLEVPKIFMVLLLVLGAAVLGEWVREVLLEFSSFPLQKTIASFSKVAIIFIGAVVGLQNIGINTDFLNLVVDKLLTGVVWGIAIAFGLAFGLGGQKDAADMIKTVRKRFHF
jgi:hypothetical protein